MKRQSVKKIMVIDQGHPVFYQLMTEAKKLFGSDVEYVRLAIPVDKNDPDSLNHMKIADEAESVIRSEDPDVILIGATALGEELAPALGVRLETGVAAHCIEIRFADDEIAYMVPAFGGKVIGEIFIPQERPAIATVKPGIFDGDEETAGDCRRVEVDLSPEAGAFASGVRCKEIRQHHSKAENLAGAKIIFCGGFGIGSKENWEKIEQLAEKYGGAAGCTRPVVDMGWGPSEDSMIGTSGKTVKPKVYIGFGISGAAHHLCGIRDTDVIISINNDKEAEVFKASDYVGVFDAEKIIDQLLCR